VTLNEISFEPRAEVQFSACDINLLLTWSRIHYDGVCKSAGRPGGFLFGISNMAPEYKATLTNHQVDTLAKICEVGTLVANPVAEELTFELRRVMDTLLRTNPKPVKV
jgi:hypothetical protein